MNLSPSLRFDIRLVQCEDVEAIFKIKSNPLVAYANATDVHHSLEETLASIREFYLKKPPHFTAYGVIEKTSGYLMGVIDFYHYNILKKEVTLGYSFNPEYWGKGYATESLQILIKLLEESYHIKTIKASVLMENKRSINVLKRLGFKYIKTEYKVDKSLLHYIKYKEK